MSKYCCPDFEKSLAYEKSSFTSIDSSKKCLLFVGKNKTTYKNVKNLVAAVKNEVRAGLKNISEHEDDEIVTVPVMLPINYCPFCGKEF